MLIFNWAKTTTMLGPERLMTNKCFSACCFHMTFDGDFRPHTTKNFIDWNLTIKIYKQRTSLTFHDLGKKISMTWMFDPLPIWWLRTTISRVLLLFFDVLHFHEVTRHYEICAHNGDPSNLHSYNVKGSVK